MFHPTGDMFRPQPALARLALPKYDQRMALPFPICSDM